MTYREVVPFRADAPPTSRSGESASGSRPGPPSTVQGTLALDLQPRHDPPSPAPSDKRADVVPIRPTRSPGDIRNWAWRFGQAAVEIVGGDRPVSQLLRWTTAEVYEDLAERAQLIARAGQHTPGQGRPQPVRPRVVAIHISEPRPGAAEVALHVRYGARSRAVAARFEERAGRWVCTALEFA